MSTHLEKTLKLLFTLCALFSIAAIGLICGFLFVNGFDAISEIGALEFLLGTTWAPQNVPPSFAIAPMIIGSVWVTITALLISVPLGLFTAVTLAMYTPKRLYRCLKSAVGLLAGIPSVVYGFFGLMVFVPFVKEEFGGKGSSILTAGLLLGIMILPNIIEVSESALRSVPLDMLEGSLALGADKEHSIIACLIPAAKTGILASVVLGLGRALGETMAVMLVVGNQPRIPSGILDGVRTLTTNIVIEMGYAEGLHRRALIATGTVLFVFILLINAAVAWLCRKADRYE